MELSVGDKVVYPRHGVGQIVGIEELDLVEGFERYYVIEIPDQHLTVRVPIRNLEGLGVRPVMSREKLLRVLETLRSEPRPLSDDYRERQDWVRERLETGGPLRIAEIVRDLTWHEQRAHLTKVDTDLLARGRDFLSAEIAFVTDTEIIDAKQAIDDALTSAVAYVPVQ
jgi:CarD family transcriptional regulator